MKTFLNVKFISTCLLFFVIFLTSSSISFAQKQADIMFETNQTNAGIGEEFLLDVFINPQKVAINGVTLSIVLPSNISFVRYQDGVSLDGLWVNAPVINSNTVSFARIFLSNFTGTIDPFNYTVPSKAKIVQLVVRGKQQGTGFVQVKKAIANKADGTGNEFLLTSEPKMITITNVENEQGVTSDDKNKPILDVKLVPTSNDSTEMLLVAQAKDNETGIKSLHYKFDNKKWNEFESPLSISETCFNTITVKATDWNGNETISDKLVNQHKKCDQKNWPVIGFIALLVLAMVVYVVGKEKKK